MPNVIISPNMNLPVPVVGVDPGPDYATNINSCMSNIDQHNHSFGQGVQINPTGININSDLSFNSNNATNLRTSRYSSQSAVLTNPTDIDCVYVVGVDLYYNDGNGNNIRITQSGSVTGSAGTITGLPSGTASASFSAGTFTFLGATNTPATMAIGPIVLGNATANSKTITIAPNNSIASNYNLTLPAAPPASTNYVTLDNSGNLSFNTTGFLGESTNAVMLGAEGTWTPTYANVSNTSGPTLVAGRYQQIGNYVYCGVVFQINFTNPSLGTANCTLSLPVAPTNNFSNTNQLWGTPSNSSSTATINATTSAKTLNLSFIWGGTVSGFSGTLVFTYITNT